MGSQAGCIGGGNLSEQLKAALGTTAGVTGTTNVVPPAVQTGTVTSAGIDTLGFNAAFAIINVGAIGSAGKYTVKVQTSSDDGVADAYVDASTLDSSPAFGAVATSASAVGATANTDVTLVTDLRKLERYIRYIGSLISGTSVLFGITVVLGAGELQPASAN